LLGGCFMLSMALLLATEHAIIARCFTHDTVVVTAAVPLLMVGGAFQFFDGVQVTTTGALRGAGITKPGLVAHLTGYWVIGLPVGLWLAFAKRWGAQGLWTGLALGLLIAAVGLTFVWIRTLRRGLQTRAA